MLAVLGSNGSAAAEPTAEHVTEVWIDRGVHATWWDVEGRTGIFYGLSVYEQTSPHQDRPRTIHAEYLTTICHTTKRGKPAKCYDGTTDYHVKVVSFDMDPLLDTATVVVADDGRRGTVTWSGYDDRGPPAGTGGWQKIYPPERTDVFVDLWASQSREATAAGDLFGVGLHARQIDWAGMWEMAYFDQYVCVALTDCEDVH